MTLRRAALLFGLAVSLCAQDERARLRPLADQSKGATTGIAVGAHVPDFSAVDLNGQPQTFETLKGPKGLVLLFARSADWCPYCKTQLADLNRQVEGFRKQGVNVASVTYDSTDILKTFAGRIGIHYPMLSDPQSATIRAFGILNTSIDPSTARYGIPYPGTYIVNEKGIVTAKYFDDDYRERSSAASILTREFGTNGVMVKTFENNQLKLSYSASDAALPPGGRTALVIDIELKPYMHVYAPGVENYMPIDWQMADSKAWLAFPAAYPPSHKMNLPAIKETVPVYTNHVRIVRDLTIGLDPETSGVLSADRKLSVDGSFRYQACDDKECFLPKTIPLTWTFEVGHLDTERVPKDLQRKAQ